MGALVVPALVAGLPFLVVLAIIALQALVGAAWLPLARRQLGGSGIPAPRLPSTASATESAGHDRRRSLRDALRRPRRPAAT